MATRHSLTRWRGEAGDPEGARAATEQLLTEVENTLGRDHPNSLAIRGHSVAWWRGQAGDPAGAVAALEELLTDQLQILGPNHLDTLATRHDLALWQGQAADPAGAVAALEELLSDQLQILGSNHPHTQTTRVHLADWRDRCPPTLSRGHLSPPQGSIPSVPPDPATPADNAAQAAPEREQDPSIRAIPPSPPPPSSADRLGSSADPAGRRGFGFMRRSKRLGEFGAATDQYQHDATRPDGVQPANRETGRDRVRMRRTAGIHSPVEADWISHYALALSLTDALSWALGEYVGYLARGHASPGRIHFSINHPYDWLISAFIWVASMALAGAYRSAIVGSGIEEFRRVVGSSSCLTALLLIILIFHPDDVRDRVLIALPVATVGTLAFRIAARRILYRMRLAGAAGHRVVVVGKGPTLDDLIGRLPMPLLLGYMGVVSLHGRCDT
jgi:hypothetical protein